MMLSSFSSNLKPPVSSLKNSSFSRLSIPIRHENLPFHSFPVKTLSLNPNSTHNFLGFSLKNLGVLYRRNVEFCVNAEHRNGGEIGTGGVDEDERKARGESTMPDQFRYLTKEAVEPPVRWPWFIALAFLLYAWRAVLFELSNWRKATLSILRFVGYLLKLSLALVYRFIGDPITYLIMSVETAIYMIRSFYSGIIAYAPIQELSTIIILASAVLAIGEATVPNSVNSQPYILTLSGLIGYAAVRGNISEPLFWTLLLGLYGFSRLIKKRDDVSSALPVAAVLAAVGEPWIRIVAITSYLALAIFHHSKKTLEEREDLEAESPKRRIPLPLLAAALAIGIRAAAKWAGYRHLTWMIV